jgi:hypothetical protein
VICDSLYWKKKCSNKISSTFFIFAFGSCHQNSTYNPILAILERRNAVSQAIFALCMLPSCGPLGSQPTVSLAEILSLAEGEAQRAVLEAVALEGDLALYEEALLGQDRPRQPLVLDDNLSFLPDFLQGEDPDARYGCLIAHQIAVGQRYGAGLLKRRAGFELALRESLARTRAERLGREWQAPENTLGQAGADADLIDDCLAQFDDAQNARQALHAIAHCRLAFLARQERFDFSLDQLVRYAFVILTLEEAA